MAIDNLFAKGRRWASAATLAAIATVASLESCCDCDLPTNAGATLPAQQYIVVARNEEAPPLNNPARYLTTTLTLNNNSPQVQWDRDDGRSYFVSSDTAIDAMSIHAHMLPNRAIDNIAPGTAAGAHIQYTLASNIGVSSSDTANIPSQLARGLHLAVGRSSIIKWGSTLIVAEDAGGTYTPEIREMLRGWLYPESDPHAKATILPNGTDAQGRHIYRITIFREETDHSIVRELTADFNFGTGAMNRVDALSDLSGAYTKLAAGCSDANGFIQKNFGVDNRSVASSNLYMPTLTAPNCWPGRAP